MAEPSSLPTRLTNGRPRQAVTGVVPPKFNEALIREAWPTVVGVNAGLAGLGKLLTETYILAAWLSGTLAGVRPQVRPVRLPPLHADQPATDDPARTQAAPRIRSHSPTSTR